MTAGQRNCFESMAECLDRYQLDDVLFALHCHLFDAVDIASGGANKVRQLKLVAKAAELRQLAQQVEAEKTNG
jgi:hypothetical protein